MARVCVLYQYYCTPAGSWGTRYYEFARRWVREGHEVTIVTSCYDKSDLKAESFITRQWIEGVQIVTLNIGLSNHHGNARRISTFLLYALSSAWIGARSGCDTLVASSGPLTVALPALLIKLLRRVYFIFEVRDVLPDTAIGLGALRGRLPVALSRALAKAAYHFADTVVALSPDMSRRVLEVEPDAHVVMIPNGADLDLFAKAENAPLREPSISNPFVVLYAGTLGPANDIDEMLGIAEELKRRGESGIKLHVVGDGKHRNRLESEARFRELDNLTVLGLMPKTSVASMLQNVDIALLTFAKVNALAWSSPNKLFDALAAGVPVLNNTPGWIQELIASAHCGHTYGFGDYVNAVDWILKIRDNPVLARTMGNNASRLARERFSRDDLSSQFSQLFLT